VYLTLSLRNLGFNTTESALLSIPAYVIGGLGLVGTAYLSEAINSRTLATVITQIWTLPLLISLRTFDSHTSQWVYFAVVTLIVGFPYVHPIQVAWASRNSYSVRTRTVSASVYNMFVQAGAIIYVSVHALAPRVHALNLIRTTSIATTTNHSVRTLFSARTLYGDLRSILRQARKQSAHRNQLHEPVPIRRDFHILSHSKQLAGQEMGCNDS